MIEKEALVSSESQATLHLEQTVNAKTAVPRKRKPKLTLVSAAE